MPNWDTVSKETNIIIQQKLVKNPNWKETDQLAITKHAGVEFGPTKDKSSSGREKNLNDLGPPVYKSSALTTRPRSPLYFLKHKDRFLRKNRVQSVVELSMTAVSLFWNTDMHVRDVT